MALADPAIPAFHESRGVQKIGRTLCINPGSDFTSGVLRGAVVDRADDGSCMDFLLTHGLAGGPVLAWPPGLAPAWRWPVLTWPPAGWRAWSC